MTELTQENALKAMRKAHEAGDMEAAKRMAKLAKSLEGKSEPVMSQFNAGVGAIVDLVNPFDTPAVSQAVGMGDTLSTGSAAEAMNKVGIPAATDDPEGVFENFMRGSGEASAALIPVVKALQAARQAGGIVGSVADDAYNAMLTKLGATAEVAAGGVSRASGEGVREAGGPEWLAQTAEVAAPMAMAGLPAAARYTPSGFVARKAVEAVAPMTRSGGREVARSRVRELMGGEDRAAQQAELVNPQDEFGLTPAQQTQDPNLLGLERAAELENPELRDRLAARRQQSEQSISQAATDMGGDVEDARTFFDRRTREVRANLAQRIDEALSGAEADLARAGPRNSETENSVRMTNRLKAELDNAQMEERALWAAVPKEVTVTPSQARQAARQWADELGRAGSQDMPAIARRLLLDEGGYGDAETAREVHRLYSKLRETARNARAGTQQRNTLAKVADDIADALLDDLGAVDAPTDELGRSLNEARAYTRAMAETFDQGAVGRILRRTQAGDEQIAPETAMSRTVGRGGAAGMSDDAGIRQAAPDARQDVTDYLRGRFSESVTNASGEFTPKQARTWMRNNQELLRQYPDLRAELNNALKSRESADLFAIRSQERLKLAEQGPIRDFNSGQADKAVTAILGADSPVKAARRIASEARRDTTGKALAGVKGAFSDYLTTDVQKLPALLSDSKTRQAMAQVFPPDEMRRWEMISRAMKGLQAKPQDVGEVIDSPGNRLLSLAVRVFAARQGAQMGGSSMAGGIQAANIAVGNAQRVLKGLTNAKARQLLMDAVEDPALMRELMTEPRGVQLPKRTRQKLAPYLVGAASTQTEGE